MKLPFPGAIQERVTDPLHAGALLRLSGWTESPGYFAVDGKSGAIVRTALLPPSKADFSAITSTLVRVRSHDGVEVPVSLVHAKKLARDGSARVLLDAYGAYGISQEPYFFPSLLAWLERGGVFAVAHVRGGGELGKQWHLGGFKASKANSWRDAIAAAEWLVREELDHARAPRDHRRQRRRHRGGQRDHRSARPLRRDGEPGRLPRHAARRNRHGRARPTCRSSAPSPPRTASATCWR